MLNPAGGCACTLMAADSWSAPPLAHGCSRYASPPSDCAVAQASREQALNFRRTLLPTAPSPLVADALKVEPVTDKLRGSSRGRISRLREWRNGRRDGFRCHCPMGVGVRIPPRALYEGGLQPRASAHLMPPTRVRPASRTAVASTGGR